jgi:hypothetical protein
MHLMKAKEFALRLSVCQNLHRILTELYVGADSFMVTSIPRNFLTSRFLVPVGVLLWLLICLAFMLLIPPADAQSTAHGCPSNKTQAMDGVWSSTRLRIINLCVPASAFLNYAEVWPGDKDMNLYVTADTSLQSNRKGIQNIQSWCEAQDTRTVAEGGSMDPEDPCRTGEGSGSPWQPGHLASNMNWEIIEKNRNLYATNNLIPDRTVPPQKTPVSVYGVYVRDKWHGYNEIHPITELTYNGCTRDRLHSFSC